MTNKEIKQYLRTSEKEDKELIMKIRQCERRMDKTLKEIRAVI